MFFIRDGMQFPDLVHSLQPNPKTNIQEGWRIVRTIHPFPSLLTLPGMLCRSASEQNLHPAVIINSC